MDRHKRRSGFRFGRRLFLEGVVVATGGAAAILSETGLAITNAVKQSVLQEAP